MSKIEKIIKESALKIKKILVAEAKKVDFPKEMFGVYDPKYADATQQIISTTLGSVNNTSYGIAKQKKAILIYNANRFWTENEMVFMLPSGLYHFHESTFVEKSFGKFSDLNNFPDWKSKKERLSDYHVYGEKALEELKNFR